MYISLDITFGQLAQLPPPVSQVHTIAAGFTLSGTQQQGAQPLHILDTRYVVTTDYRHTGPRLLLLITDFTQSCKWLQGWPLPTKPN